MPRTTIDFHETRHHAAIALSSLREVGLHPGDIGGAWLDEAATAPEQHEDTSLQATRQTVDVSDLGRVQFTGWLAEAALLLKTVDEPTALSAILGDHVDEADLSRIRETISGGGGIVGIRARDVFNPEID